MVAGKVVDTVKDHFRGVLLGTMAGDALGMPVEGIPIPIIQTHYGRVEEMVDARLGRGTYTDDTEMMIGLAEALLETPGRMDLDRVAHYFGENYRPDRGYGGNTHRILRAIQQGQPWREAVQQFLLPGGSFANGAAMRVAPVAIAFFPDGAAISRASQEQAEVSGHTHPIGLFGAHLQAMAVYQALFCSDQGLTFDPRKFLLQVQPSAPEEYKISLSWIEQHLAADLEEAAKILGTGSRASQSVPAALWAFLSARDDPEEAIIRAVNMGGDADTIGAMAGAIAGAYHGATALPGRWLEALENTGKGRDYVVEMADHFFELFVSRQSHS